MTDEMEALLARAAELEDENALLRSMQSPGGDETDLKVENVLLREELAHVREAAPAASGPRPVQTQVPRTLQEFLALSPEQRQAAARQMSRKQRDDLLGRKGPGPDAESYL